VIFESYRLKPIYARNRSWEISAPHRLRAIFFARRKQPPLRRLNVSTTPDNLTQLKGESMPRPSQLLDLAELLKLPVEQLMAPIEACPEPVVAYRMPTLAAKTKTAISLRSPSSLSACHT
jgi:hypothetical protein